MFDLEQRLGEWKAGFASMESLREADVEELEQHVRDAMAPLTASGLDREEAFIIATRRVGAPAAVGHEFAKVNGTHVWSQRAFWLVAGALGYVVCRMVIGASASIGVLLVALAGGRGSSMGYTAVALTCAGWLLVAAMVYRWRDQSARTAPLRRRSAGLFAIGVTLALVVAAAMSFGSQVVMAQLMPMSEFGRATMMSNLAAWVTAVLMPLALFVVLLTRGRHAQERGGVES
jgi:hypothetical protein